MATKKIPISLSEQDIAEISELALLLGLGGTYGEIPKTLKFSITYTLAKIKQDSKVIPDLNADEMTYYFQSLKRLKAEQIKAEAIKKLAETPLKV